MKQTFEERYGPEFGVTLDEQIGLFTEFVQTDIKSQFYVARDALREAAQHTMEEIHKEMKKRPDVFRSKSGGMVALGLKGMKDPYKDWVIVSNWMEIRRNPRTGGTSMESLRKKKNGKTSFKKISKEKYPGAIAYLEEYESMLFEIHVRSKRLMQAWKLTYESGNEVSHKE